jgi:hypothetical protein
VFGLHLVPFNNIPFPLVVSSATQHFRSKTSKKRDQLGNLDPDGKNVSDKGYYNIFWDVTLCSPVKVHRRFGGALSQRSAYSIHLA